MKPKTAGSLLILGAALAAIIGIVIVVTNVLKKHDAARRDWEDTILGI